MHKIQKLLSSYKTSIILLLIYAVMMALGTYIEEVMSTEAAKMLVYYSPLFIAVHLLFIVNFLLITIEKRFVKTRRWTLLVIHIALIVIMLGAMTTHLFGKEGVIHLRVGDKTDMMTAQTSRGVINHQLPFTVELSAFRLVRYPGSSSASSYESDLIVQTQNETIEQTILMNRVMDVKGYRLFQSSYDEDEQGSVLAVNHDVGGRAITYTGYTLLIVGFIMMFVSPRSRLRRLYRQLKRVRGRVVVVGALLLLSVPMLASNLTQHAAYLSARRDAIPLNQAEQFGTLPIQFQGRIVPMNTFSAQVLRKLYHKEQMGSLTSDQFLLGLITNPQIWMQVPFLSVKDEGLARLCATETERVAYAQLFDEGGSYRLTNAVTHASHLATAERSATDKALLKLDEQVNIIYMLVHGLMPNLFPHPDNAGERWYAPGSDLSAFGGEDSLFVADAYTNYLSEIVFAKETNSWVEAEAALDAIKAYQLERDSENLIYPEKIKAEMRYNRLQVFSSVQRVYLLVGALLLIVALLQLLRPAKWLRWITYVAVAIVIAAFAYHAYGMLLRWNIAGYAPWSNSYETMVYVGWSVILAGFIFGRRNTLILALATLLGGVVLFVSRLSWMDPQITTLVPVLKSRWLMFHVAVTISAYGFFGISFLLGLVNLLLMAFGKKKGVLLQQLEELTIVNNMSLLIGLALMTTGTFLGAVWANESWGRYWSWDPKETWALITVVIYGAVTHLHLLKSKNYNWLFNFSSVMAFGSVLMTYLGVNYFLGGLHSYGENEGLGAMLSIVALMFGAIVVLGAVAWYKKSRTTMRR